MGKKNHSSLDTKKTALKLYFTGKHSAKEMSENLGISITTFFRWLKKYRANNDFEELDNAHGGGPEKKISPYWMRRIVNLILKPADRYGFSDGLWSTSRIVQAVSDKFEMKISKVTVWRMLRENDFFYKSPELNYNEGDKAELDEWLTVKFPEILKKVRKYRGILYFLDESNIRLSAMRGKSWAPKGVRPVMKVTGKRGSISAVSAITAQGNLLFNVYDSTISSAEVEQFILYMLEHHKRRHLFIIMDNARVHKSNQIKELEKKHKRLHIEYLPPYWPKYNPDEYVWNYLKNEEMKMYSADSTEELMGIAVKALEKIAGNFKLILGIFLRCPLAHFM